MRKYLIFCIALTVFNVVLFIVGFAAVAGQVAVAAQKSDIVVVAKYIAGGLAMLGGTLGTGIAQSKIGASAVAATAEDPKNFGMGIIYVAIPETSVILGFVFIFLI